EASPHLRNKDNTGCPICLNKKVVKSNRLSVTHPYLAEQWHPTLNKDITPNDIVVGTPKKFWWKCEKGEDHIWEASPHLRSKDNTGCPFCTLTPQSRQELIITFELKQFFDINPKGFKTRVNGKLWSIDIYIPLLNLGIEFDGAYWHKDKVDFDKLKTQQLNENGFNIIRVRQSPLKRIFENDILTSKKFNGKAIANKILKQILNSHNLEDKSRVKIERYLTLDSLQNEQALNRYIEDILIEKSKRRN
ncbi:MAG: zinc-ribbon domain-containing protein, partial [Flavobacteriaceae bacterium]|nr:zinc-ribbon domain-containing protein [Flavobacteriaceae bacterium]